MMFLMNFLFLSLLIHDAVYASATRYQINDQSPLQNLRARGNVEISVPSFCYGKGQLGEMIQAISNSAGNERFVVCPDTTLDGFRYGDTITLEKENMILQCGYDGSFQNNCTFTGGYGSTGPDQVRVRSRQDETVEGIQIIGFTMMNAPNNPLGVLGAATIVDCVFSNNAGNSEFSSTQQVEIDMSNPPQTVVFRRCKFINTLTPNGNGGINARGVQPIVLDGCHFEGTPTKWAVRIYNNYGELVPLQSSLSMQNSCFLDNHPGAILLDGGIIEKNSNNYGINNGEECDGIKVTASGGTSNCLPLTADQCYASGTARTEEPVIEYPTTYPSASVNSQCDCRTVFGLVLGRRIQVSILGNCLDICAIPGIMAWFLKWFGNACGQCY